MKIAKCFRGSLEIDCKWTNKKLDEFSSLFIISRVEHELSHIHVATKSWNSYQIYDFAKENKVESLVELA